jgi:hypothetical protein
MTVTSDAGMALLRVGPPFSGRGGGTSSIVPFGAEGPG